MFYFQKYNSDLKKLERRPILSNSNVFRMCLLDTKVTRVQYVKNYRFYKKSTPLTFWVAEKKIRPKNPNKKCEPENYPSTFQKNQP